MTNAILRGMTHAGNSHGRVDDGETASAKPRRGSLLRKLKTPVAVLAGALVSLAHGAVSITSPVDYATVTVMPSVMRDFRSTFATGKKWSLVNSSTLGSAQRIEWETACRASQTAVALSWSGTGSTMCTVKVYRAKDGAEVFSATSTTGKASFPDAEIGRNYRWTVTYNSATTEGHFYVNRIAPRMMNSFGGIGNSRDLGGWTTDSGKVVRQGLVFRSEEWDFVDSATGLYRDGCEPKPYWADTVGVNLDIDLRAKECVNSYYMPANDSRAALDKSPLDLDKNIRRFRTEDAGTSVGAFPGAAGFNAGGEVGGDPTVYTADQFKRAIAYAVHQFGNRDNYPILFHCSQGTDRTGALAYLLSGLLGVSEDDRDLDFVFSYAWDADEYKLLMWDMDTIRDTVNKCSGATFKDKCVTYVKNCYAMTTSPKLSATDAENDIATFRSMMLEDPEEAATVPSGDEESFVYENYYWMRDGAGGTLSDGMSYWYKDPEGETKWPADQQNIVNNPNAAVYLWPTAAHPYAYPVAEAFTIGKLVSRISYGGTVGLVPGEPTTYEPNPSPKGYFTNNGHGVTDRPLWTHQSGVASAERLRMYLEAGTGTGSVQIWTNARLNLSAFKSVYENVYIDFPAGKCDGATVCFYGLNGSQGESTVAWIQGGQDGTAQNLIVSNALLTVQRADKTSGVAGALNLEFDLGAANETTGTMMTVNGGFKMNAGSTIRVNAGGKPAGTYRLLTVGSGKTLTIPTATVSGAKVVGCAPGLAGTVALSGNVLSVTIVKTTTTVTLGDHPHLTVAWTSGDGSVTNAVDGTDFSVAKGATNVKVFFTAESGWEIVGNAVVELGTVTEDVVFGAEGDYMVPEVAITDPCLIAFGRGSSNMTVAWTSGDGSVTNAVANKVKAMYVPRGSENVRIICTANPGYELVGESVFDLGTVTDDFTFGQGNDFVFPIAYDIAANVVYLDWDEANGRMTNAVARAGYWRSVEDSEMAYAMKGCMVVTNDVTIPIAQVAGAAVLVLCNDATLTVTGTGDEAGIHVPANASLTITVRKGSTGRVVAQGGADCAGIGSQFKQGSGSVLGAVRIVAGTVTATGGKNGAGIGNGFYGKDGSVKIFGGAVTAVGGVGAASDIGDGGNPYSPCLVSISGGIFARPVQEAWCADHFAVFDNLDPATKSDYLYEVLPASTLTIGKCPIHVSAAWTSGDGSVTNAIEDGSVVMRDGTPNVRVIFTVDDGYALDNAAVVDLGTVTGDVTFGIGNDYKVPHAVPAGAVSYLDWDAESETLTNATVAAGEWTLVTDETRTLGDGWYVVAYDVALPVGSNIVVNGSAHLILCDGARLSVTGGYDQAAIEVSRTDAVTNTLAIYGQAECTGRLTAQGGGNHAAGIGTGLYGNCGALTINGGTVTANGGFGNGWFGRDGLVAINDGKVTASGIKGCSAVIRGGIFGTAVPDAWCADHRGVFRNLDPATSTEFPYAVLPAWKVTIGDRRYMTVGWTSDDELMTNAVEGTSFKVRHGERNVRVIFTVDSEYILAGDPVVYVGTVNSDIVFGIGNDFKAPHAGVPYLDWDETNRVMTNAVSPVVCDVYSTSIRDLQDGHWYVVKGEHKISGWSGLRVSGDVHLILCDGSSLSIVLLKDPDGDGIEEPGIEVGEGASLTVYGQATGSGRLVVVGGNDGAAGIGGRMGGPCGAVTINGGEVSSAGGSDYIRGASGIGTGDGGYGGSVTINGGKVTASGNEYGAGIGADYRGRNMTVIINGGTVTATGGADGVGIGGPYQKGEGSAVTISGGAINASSMDGSIAISGGIFSAKPKDEWIESGRCRAPNMDVDTGETYPWRVVESDTVVTPGSPLGPYETAVAATNALALVEFVPSDEVADVLTTVAARTRYADWFGLGVTSKGATEWYVEAALTDAAKLTLAETAANATRQIPITDIAAMSMTGIRIVPVEGGEPGFYYTLYGAEDLGLVTPQREGASGTVNAYGPNLSGLDGKMIFWDVMKPSAASGFFTIGVSATKPSSTAATP